MLALDLLDRRQGGRVHDLTVSLPEASTFNTETTAGPLADAPIVFFATTMFGSAFLMFLVEPMVAKMVLPILGGTPMVWNTCVLFFQVLLLVGYAYAHGAARRLRLSHHACAYAAVLLAPVATLPVALRAATQPPVHSNPVAWLLVVLFLSIGLPFFALSTSASVLQHLFSRSRHRSARDPYFLYAASNVGSLLALLSYPVIVEPTLSLREQTRFWSLGYTVFVGLALVCVSVGSRGARAPMETQPPHDASPDSAAGDTLFPWSRRARWLVCAFIPASLMLAVTTYLSTDIAPVPLLWVAPLALYLSTFVMAFGAPRPTLRAFADGRLPLLAVALAVFMIVHAVGPTWLIVPIHLFAFTLAAFMCHADLADDRPPASQLTQFYFWIALGGMLGGLFNTLVAPALFSSVIEYPLVLVLVCLRRRGQPGRGQAAPSDREAHATAFRASFGRPGFWQRTLDVAAPIAVSGLTAGFVWYLHRRAADPRLMLLVPALLVFSQRKRPIRFACSLAALLATGLVMSSANMDGTVLYRERTFFGVYRANLDESGRYHSLFHGTTLHGLQALDPQRRDQPLTYFHRTGPFGQMFASLQQVQGADDVAVVGLGVGTLATYAGPSQRWTFFEIDPAVERIARNSTYFTFLAQCGERCHVVLGDARLSLADARDVRYGLIVLDAFSSDSIPIHLITSEAMDLYLTRLASGGVLAFHISNRHLRLGPIVGQLARAHGLIALEQIDWLGTEVRPDGKVSSDWVVMARSRQDLAPLLQDPRWKAPMVSPSTPLWTDGFSNIVGALAVLSGD